MVKATAEAHIEMSDGQQGSLLVSLAARCKQEVTLDLAKKFKVPFIRRFLISMKGRRKDKEPSTPGESKPYLEDEYVREKVVDTEVGKLVDIPHSIDRNEWLATHTISFFDHTNLLYGAVSEFCTNTGCSAMSGPANIQYLWIDEKGKKTKCPAPQYVDMVMSFAQKTIHDEAVFPTKYGNVFPSSFEVTVRKIARLLFHVLSHMYQAHYKEVLTLHLHPHLNTLFEHFMTFSRAFSLLDEKDTDALDDLHKKLVAFSGASVHATTDFCKDRTHADGGAGGGDGGGGSSGGDDVFVAASSSASAPASPSRAAASSSSLTNNGVVPGVTSPHGGLPPAPSDGEDSGLALPGRSSPLLPPPPALTPTGAAPQRGPVCDSTPQQGLRGHAAHSATSVSS